MPDAHQTPFAPSAHTDYCEWSGHAVVSAHLRLCLSGATCLEANYVTAGRQKLVWCVVADRRQIPAFLAVVAKAKAAATVALLGKAKKKDGTDQRLMRTKNGNILCENPGDCPDSPLASQEFWITAKPSAYHTTPSVCHSTASLNIPSIRGRAEGMAAAAAVGWEACKTNHARLLLRRSPLQRE